MDKHTADGLLKRFLFWRSATQTTEGTDRKLAQSHLRGFVEATGLVLGMHPAGGDAQDALAVFDRLRALAE